MHEYYAANKNKFRKGMDQFFSLVAPELEKASGKKYAEVFEEIWDYYEKHLLERFPYLRGKTLEEALREPTIVRFSGGKPERYSHMLGPICQNAAFMSDETLAREADACVTFDYPAMDRDFQRRLHFFYSREESAWRFCHRKLKRAYPYAQYRLVSGYGHVGYPGEHPEEYCGWLSALARGEALPGA